MLNISKMTELWLGIVRHYRSFNFLFVLFNYAIFCSCTLWFYLLGVLNRSC